MKRRKRRATAQKSQKISIGDDLTISSTRTVGDPTLSTPAGLYEAGLAHLQAGRYLDAQLCCQQALALDADHADVLHLMGLLCFQAEQYDHAVEWMTRAIRQNPKPDYLASLGTALERQGRREEALKVFDKAIQLEPDNAELWKNLGNVLVDLNRSDQALLSFQHVLKLNPRDWKAANKSGRLLIQMMRLDEALTYFDQCDDLQPNHAPTLQMRAVAMYGLNRFDEGLTEAMRAQALDPTNADMCNNVGAFLQRLGREEEALSWFNRALQLRPDYPAAFTNKASSLAHLRRFTEAFATFDVMKVLHPDHAEARWGRALLDLLVGNFEAGWAGREARWDVPDLPIARFKFPQPMWLGKEPIDGKTILIHVDEGLGDTIQFARYVPMVAALGARVILVVAEALCPFLSDLAGVSQCFPLSASALPAFDVYCPMGSLPFAFGTRLETIPSATPYLPSPAASRLQRWEDRLGPHNKLRVGLVWSGNPRHGNDHNRSLPLNALSSILDLDATFVSLQKDQRPDDKTTLLERSEIVDLTGHLSDFLETAALVSCLDLVITVDTSVAHLAGALGRPTWILLPWMPDYRWLLDRDDSPWYPSVRLFRQNETRQYADVLERVRDELRARIVAFRPAEQLLNTPAGLYEAGLAQLQAGRYLDAQLCCQQALALDADHADVLHLMGLLCFQAEQYDHAVEWMTRAIRQNPKPDYLSNLGSTLERQGRREEALKVFDKAVQLNPADAELWTKLGGALERLERRTDALLSFQHALKLSPRHWNAAYSSGSVLCRLGRFAEAITHFDLCRELRPDHALTWQLRGVSFASLRRFDEFLADSQTAHALDPNSAETRNNIGYALQSLGRDQEALTWLDKALEIRPDYVDALNNKIISLGQLRRFDEAFALYDRMQSLQLNNTATEWNLSFLYLLTGNFEEGWAGHEARLKLPWSTYPKFPQPMWLGEENVEGKTILVFADEGLGDTIQFVRYVPMLAERGARVVLAVHNPLIRLLSDLPGVAQCIPTSAMNLAGGFDMHCPVRSLPRAFATRLDTIPSATPYLPCPAKDRVQAWEDRLGPHARLRVGLVWSGNPANTNDHNRSIPLRTLSRFLDADATFVSLQKDPRPNDKAVLAERSDIIDLTADLTDFVETAALVSCLDLVISVDTSVAHLAGALGRPTWILLPYAPDFRWLLDCDDSPWYPSVRLFRQNETREFESVLDRVCDELRAQIMAFRPAERLILAAT